MKHAFAVPCALAALLGVSACSVLVGTSGLAGPSELPDAASRDAASPDAALDGETAPLGPSCRAIHARFPDAGTGSYTLVGDAGASVNAHCDMDSFDGGWTLVTPAMIVEDAPVQVYAPGGPAHVDVTHGIDDNGGAIFSLKVTASNCGASGTAAAPGHYFIVRELDRWTQIMATYAFGNSTSCWQMFGDKGMRDTNVLPFDLALDRIGPQTNMSRTASRTPIPFDGRTTACTENPDNFWAGIYKNDRKGARVVLRRFRLDAPAGLAVQTDCGNPTWTISDIRVR